MDQAANLEGFIRQHCPWEQLPPAVRQSFDNNRALWEKEVCAFSLRNQLPWRTSLVRKFILDERKYYSDMLRTSRERLMLFPYHLEDTIVPVLRVTPFQYYQEMMYELMLRDRTYDTLPNFTAKDCLLHLGIGRNEYIDKSNRNKSAMRFGLWNLVPGRKSPLWELLPSEPVDFRLEPWWIVRSALPSLEAAGEGSMKGLSPDDVQCLRQIHQSTGKLGGQLDWRAVRRLYKRGLVYLDVLIQENDRVTVPPLEGFVMNRVQGDYFETLLYKIFVSIDENTSIAELSNILQVDIATAKNAVSLYCRLGFAVKKDAVPRTAAGQPVALHPSWADADEMTQSRPRQDNLTAREALSEQQYLASTTAADLAPFPSSDDGDAARRAGSEDERAHRDDQSGGSDEDDAGDDDEDDDDDASFRAASLPAFSYLLESLSAARSGRETGVADTKSSEVLTTSSSTLAVDAGGTASKRIAFLFDATLTAFLMMGNLSMSLKSHAVTMFEVGKLANESLAAFMDELGKIRPAAGGDGEAQKYFDHAMTLYKTLTFLRAAADSDPSTAVLSNASGVDLLRFESLSSLDAAACQRVLARSYDVVISMAPVLANCRTLQAPLPCHFGPAIPEVNSVWFQLFLYAVTKAGPPTILLARGTRLRRLPASFDIVSAKKAFDELLATPWDQEAQILPAATALVQLNDLLLDGAVLVQGYRLQDDTEAAFVDVALPLLPADDAIDNAMRPTAEAVHRALACPHSCGYMRLLRLGERWAPLDVRFGVPLFDAALNEAVCRHARRAGIFASPAALREHVREQRLLALRLQAFIAAHTAWMPAVDEAAAAVALPVTSVSFDGRELSQTSL